MGYLILAGVIIALALATAPVIALVRFARAPSAAKRNYPKMVRARLRWRWLTRNTALAAVDVHQKKRIRDLLIPVGRADVVVGRKEHVLYPKARFRADSFGVVARVRAMPRAGRKEFDLQAQHIADAWGCTRVQVSQKAPGRLIVRGLVNDPLLAPFGIEAAPEGTYSGSQALRVFLGVDEWGEPRWRALGGLTGIAVGGLPGSGKTSFIHSLLMQLGGTPAAQFALIDMKGGGDLFDWQDRAWLHCGDSIADALGVLEDVHAEMVRRLRRIFDDRSLPRNGWQAGPQESNPLVVTVIDECHGLFDLDGWKGDRDKEAMVRRARMLAAQLVRKGRSALMLSVFASQKQTVDSIPSIIRDNCALGLSFATKTRDASVAALGEAIREYPGYCPTTLKDPAYTGVCTVSLPNGSDPFVRLRVPEVTEEAAAARAMQTVQFRRDPSDVKTNHLEVEPVMV